MNTKQRGAGVKATMIVAVAAVSFGCGAGSLVLSDRVHERESVPTSELVRLAACDRAVEAAGRYDVVKAEGGDVGGVLPVYWSAKAACSGSSNVKAAK